VPDMRVDRVSRILIEILHEKKIYSSSLKLNIYYVCQYPKHLPNEILETSLYTRIRLDRIQEKKSPERDQCIRKQEKYTDTQALAVKTQKLTDTICHKIKQKSADGYSSPGNKTKQSAESHILVGHKENLLKHEIKVHWHMHLRREQSKTL
jgi:hypothetical protein